MVSEMRLECSFDLRIGENEALISLGMWLQLTGKEIERKNWDGDS